jgi:hypothetical protein
LDPDPQHCFKAGKIRRRTYPTKVEMCQLLNGRNVGAKTEDPDSSVAADKATGV